MIDNIYIRLGMFVNNNVRLHFLCTSHVIQFLKMVRYSSDTRIKLTTFSRVMWYKNKMRTVIINTLRPTQNGCHFANDIFKCISLNENVQISSKISLRVVPKDPINNMSLLVQVMAWCWQGNKPLSKSMMVISSTHVCVTRLQWVKKIWAWAGHPRTGFLPQR